jgi:hypothetical protein
MEIAKNVLSAEISAVITRADGTVEDLGVIDSTDGAECGRCNARMRRFELKKHTDACAKLAAYDEIKNL